MKFENPSWQQESPGPLTDRTAYRFHTLVEGIAAQGRAHDILEDFKWWFSGGTSSRSSTEYDARYDLLSLMKTAADTNGPSFIAAFIDACVDLKGQGYRVPSVDEINIILTQNNTGFQVDGDTVVQRRWVPRDNLPVVETDEEVVESAAMKFADPSWLFETPGPIPKQVVDDFHELISKITTQGETQGILEHFKSFFAAAHGVTSTSWSSSLSWADSDLRYHMDEAAANAPAFINAFMEGCLTLQKNKGLAVPAVKLINQLLAKHGAGYQIDGETISATGEVTDQPSPEVGPVAVAPATSTSARTSSSIKPGSVSVTTVALRVFLCHSAGDKKQVRELYTQLTKDGFLPWLDEEDLIPGQDWQMEIRKAVKSSHVVIVCLSNASMNQAGYVHKEIGYALDRAEEQPEGTIFVIPARLEECTVPERLRKWQWVDLYQGNGYNKLKTALDKRAATLT